tara:strand:- start:4485 stop:4670 length:186 start_codon:yes stop_codon:yes gene_type:complete
MSMPRIVVAIPDEEYIKANSDIRGRLNLRNSIDLSIEFLNFFIQLLIVFDRTRFANSCRFN